MNPSDRTRTMHNLLFMSSPDHVDAVRSRIYGGEDTEAEKQRVNFVKSCAGAGVIDSEAYDGFVAALQGRGWLPPKPDLEPNPDGAGKIGRWRLTAKGRTESADYLS